MNLSPEDKASARRLIDTAQQAAKSLRRETGIVARVLAWLERRSAIKLQEKQRKRCRSGVHDIEQWEALRITDVYAEGKTAADSYPVKRTQTWLGHCTHCNAPETRKQNI